MSDKSTTPPHPPTYIEWQRRGLEFDAGRHAGQTVCIDGDAKAGPGPFDLLLCAIAACASTDVITMLETQRASLASLRVDIEARRIGEAPRRLDSAVLHFKLAGSSLTLEQAERTVAAAITQYCGVRASLTENAAVSWTVELRV